MRKIIVITGMEFDFCSMGCFSRYESVRGVFFRVGGKDVRRPWGDLEADSRRLRRFRQLFETIYTIFDEEKPGEEEEEISLHRNKKYVFYTIFRVSF